MDLKFLKFEKKFKKKEHQPDPDFYWRIIFGVTAVLVLSGVVFAGYLMKQINQQDFSLSLEYGGEARKISNDRIDKVLQYFTNRENKSKDILVLPSPKRDPSI